MICSMSRVLRARPSFGGWWILSWCPHRGWRAVLAGDAMTAIETAENPATAPRMLSVASSAAVRILPVSSFGPAYKVRGS